MWYHLLCTCEKNNVIDNILLSLCAIVCYVETVMTQKYIHCVKLDQESLLEECIFLELQRRRRSRFAHSDIAFCPVLVMNIKRRCLSIISRNA